MRRCKNSYYETYSYSWKLLDLSTDDKFSSQGAVGQTTYFVDKIWKGLGFYPVYKLNNYPIIVLYGLAKNIGVFDGRQRTYYSQEEEQPEIHIDLCWFSGSPNLCFCSVV